MAVTMMKYELAGAPDLCPGELACYEFRPGEESEALEFLDQRPILCLDGTCSSKARVS